MVFEDLDLDAVNVSVARRPFSAGGKVHCEWAQESDTVSIYLAVGAVRGKDLKVKIKEHLLIVESKNGGGIFLNGDLPESCIPDESEWEVVDGEMRITLRKTLQREWQVPLHPAPSVAMQQAEPPPQAGPIPKRPVPIVDKPLSSGSSDDEPCVVDVSEASSATPAGKPATSDELTEKVLDENHGCPMEPAKLHPKQHPKPPVDTSGGLNAAYREWDRFDDLGAIQKMENEGKTEEGNGIAMRASPYAVGVEFTDYAKDREEVSLDEELTAKREHLQNTINTRMVNAGRLKAKGNEKLAKCDDEGALRCYLEGMQELSLGESAKILLSKRLCTAMEALLVDLRSNAAAACLKIEDWDGAIESADQVLESQPDHGKALYRRAKAYAAQGMHSMARTDLGKLLTLQPSNAAAKKVLSELPVPDTEVL